MSVNKVILIGRLGKDPETKFTPSGMQITRLTLATSEKTKKGDNWEEKTEWHNVVTFNKQAQFSAEYLKKGNQVFIEGKISTSSWQDESGKKHYKTEIIANTVQNLTPKQENSTSNNNNYQPQQNESDDLPF